MNFYIQGLLLIWETLISTRNIKTQSVYRQLYINGQIFCWRKHSIHNPFRLYKPESRVRSVCVCVCVFIKYATYAITLMEKRYTDTNHRCLLIQLLKTHTEQRLPQANPHFFHLMNIPSLNDAEKRRDLCRITCAVFIIGCHS